jgi:hypothetical protein
MNDTPLINDGRIFYVDIDRTLIEPIENPPAFLTDDPSIVYINSYPYRKKLNNIEIVKRFGHHVGLSVIFWSAGGGKWAHEVAKALHIDKYGIAFISKPSWYIDDLQNAGFVGVEGTWIDALNKDNIK